MESEICVRLTPFLSVDVVVYSSCAGTFADAWSNTRGAGVVVPPEGEVVATAGAAGPSNSPAWDWGGVEFTAGDEIAGTRPGWGPAGGAA